MTMMLMFTTTVFVETIFLKIVAQPNRKLPAWLQSLTSFVQRSEVFQYFVASPFDAEKKVKLNQSLVEAVEVPIESTENTILPTPDQPEQTETDVINDWSTFCRTIDRTLFLALIIGYATYKGQ